MWLYENKEIKVIEDLPEKVFGFVYKTINKETGKFYIGKKFIFHTTKKKIGKEQKAKNKLINVWKDFEYIVKESDWKSYYGSAKELKEDITQFGKENFERNILKLCYSSKELNYWETAYQFKEDVLLVDSYCDNIAGRYFRKDFIK
jgi:hypothetical protein